MGSYHLQMRKIINDIFKSAWVRIVKSPVTAMNKQRDFPLNIVEYFKQSPVVHIETLCIGVKFYPLQTRFYDKVRLGKYIFTVGVECSETVKFITV